MNKRLTTIALLALWTLAACQRPAAPPEDPAVWKKIKLDFRNIDADGLTGPPDGKVSVYYEFCIPADDKSLRKVRKIDPTANVMKGSKGRVGCSSAQWLIIGNTRQARYQRVLYELACLPYVEKIQQTFFE